MPVSSCPGDDEGEVPRRAVVLQCAEDLEAGVDPHPVVERRRQHPPVRERLGRPVEHDRVARADELEGVLATGRADVDAQAVPRDLDLLRRDDDPANLTRRCCDPDALPRGVGGPPTGELTDREEPVLARVAHRHPNLIGMGEQPQGATADRACDGRNCRAEHVALDGSADRGRLASHDPLHGVLMTRGAVGEQELGEKGRDRGLDAHAAATSAR